MVIEWLTLVKAIIMIGAERRLGGVRLDGIVGCYAPLALLAPAFTYYMAVCVQKSAKPFPHSTITQTANGYPQSTLFRCICGAGAAVLALMVWAIHRWLQTAAERAGFRKMPRTSYFCMLGAMLLFCIATQSIDGQGNGPLHTPSAVLFFIVLEVFIVETTLYLRLLHEWDTSALAAGSLRVKELLCGYVTAVWLYCLYGTYGQQNSVDYSVVVEWNAYFISYLWIFSFYQEWRQVRLVLAAPE